MEATSAITISSSPEAVYRRWRDFEHLPDFMFHLESVTVTGPATSRWVAKAPAGTSVSWDAEIVEDVPGERITWRSVEGGSVDTTGAITFRPAPAGQGTEVNVSLSYAPPGGALGAAVAKLFGEEPGQQVADDLRRFKQLLETGEIARSDGAPLGTYNRNQVHQQDAHPLEGPAADMVRATSNQEVGA